MQRIIYFLVLQVIGFFALFAQHDHDHDHLYERMDILHTKSIVSSLDRISKGQASEDTVFGLILKSFSDQKIPVEDIFKKAGLDIHQHTDIYAFYKEQKGRLFSPNPGLKKYLFKMAKVRNSQPYAAQSYTEQFQITQDIKLHVPEGLLQQTLLATTMVFMESAAFWDYQLNFHPTLAPSVEDPIRRDSRDASIFSSAYQAMRELGLCHEDAHIIASVETAWQAAFCSGCGVW